MRIAIISDIHGNCIALEAVLDHIATQHVTQLICLGDVASTGPQPVEAIRRLQALGCPVVKGNMDDWLLQPEPKPQLDRRRQRWQDVDIWCAKQLSAADQAYLRTFQPTIKQDLPGEKTLLCYHGSPHSYNERILSTSTEQELEQAFMGTNGQIMVGGHTHIQMLRRFKDILILNPGSVGLAMDRITPTDEIRRPSWAEYAIVDSNGESLHVELHRIAFDFQKFIQAIKTSGMPHADWWAKQ
jgi:putative phosphoesterase